MQFCYTAVLVDKTDVLQLQAQQELTFGRFGNLFPGTGDILRVGADFRDPYLVELNATEFSLEILALCCGAVELYELVADHVYPVFKLFFLVNLLCRNDMPFWKQEVRHCRAPGYSLSVYSMDRGEIWQQAGVFMAVDVFEHMGLVEEPTLTG